MENKIDKHISFTIAAFISVIVITLFVVVSEKDSELQASDNSSRICVSSKGYIDGDKQFYILEDTENYIEFLYIVDGSGTRKRTSLVQIFKEEIVNEEITDAIIDK